MNNRGEYQPTKIRACVTVGVDGSWQVAGWGYGESFIYPASDTYMKRQCEEHMESPVVSVTFIEAEIPAPEAIQAEIGPQFRCDKCGQRFSSMPHAHMNKRDTGQCDGTVVNLSEPYDTMQDEKAMAEEEAA